jgi:hypothetical protein
MHSELVADQDRCVRLREAFGDPELLKYATLHRDIVVKFGRFPHRNRAMGRDTTPAEQAFLGGGGFAESALRIPSASRRDQRGKSKAVVPGTLKMKSSPMILAGVQHPEANPFAVNRSTMATQ